MAAVAVGAAVAEAGAVKAAEGDAAASSQILARVLGFLAALGSSSSELNSSCLSSGCVVGFNTAIISASCGPANAHHSDR